MISEFKDVDQLSSADFEIFVRDLFVASGWSDAVITEVGKEYKHGGGGVDIFAYKGKRKFAIEVKQRSLHITVDVTALNQLVAGADLANVKNRIEYWCYVACQMAQNLTLRCTLFGLLRECAEAESVVLEGSLSEICRLAAVNRTQLYERKAQLREALAEVELAGPSRPTRSESPAMNAEIPAGYGVREQVLRYRLDHPGAVVPHPGGSMSYSDGFRRFILDLSDTSAVRRGARDLPVPHRPPARRRESRCNPRPSRPESPAHPMDVRWPAKRDRSTGRSALRLNKPCLSG